MLAGYLYYTVWGRVREDRWAYIRQGTGVRDRDRERMDIRMRMNAGGEAEGRSGEESYADVRGTG